MHRGGQEIENMLKNFVVYPHMKKRQFLDSITFMQKGTPLYTGLVMQHFFTTFYK